jgi:ankyrin repeat protein
MEKRNILQKIAENSDDKTALAILATNKEMNKDLYYDVIFGKRYPDLIRYRGPNLSVKKLYLGSLEIIGKLKEQFNYTYVSGNPQLQLYIFMMSQKNVINLLLNASIKGSLELVKYALEQGANIHFNNDEALRWASEKGHLEVVKYLVEQGANIHAENDIALRHASSDGYFEVVKYLVEKGANIHALDDGALRWASENGHFEVVKYLVEHGANIHAEHDWALRLASKYGQLEVVKYLVEKGANIHAENDFALRWASKKGHLEVVKYLKSLK